MAVPAAARGLAGALALALLAAGGCATSSTYRDLTVEVRDAQTGAPVPAAVVHARPVSFYRPAPPFDVIDPAPPRSARVTTGADGSARMSVIVRHPVQFVVAAAGYAPLVVHLEVRPPEDAPSGWFGDGEPAGGPALEVRFRPGPVARPGPDER